MNEVVQIGLSIFTLIFSLSIFGLGVYCFYVFIKVIVYPLMKAMFEEEVSYSISKGREK